MKEIYVAPNGDNLNPGSYDKPLKTISKAFSISVPGDKILLKTGTYREKVEIFSGGGTRESPIKLSSVPGEKVSIRGSDVVKDWTIHNSYIWKKTGIDYNPQQVFVDFDDNHKLPLKQIGKPAYNYSSFHLPIIIGSDLSTMIESSFYYDKSTKTLYVWLPNNQNPNEHTMEVSSRNRIFFSSAPYIDIENLSFYHSSAGGEQSSAVELGPGSVMKNCNVQYCDFTGLGMGYLKSDTKVYDSNLSYNGNSGINAPGTKNFLIYGCRMNGNNYRNFNPLWHAGGFKAAAKSYGTLENNEVAFNNGSGIWFDYCNSGSKIIVKNNHIHDNQPKEAAIFLEVTTNADVYANRITNNTRRGIYISASNNVTAYANEIIGTKGYSAIEIHGMPRDGASLKNNHIHSNIIQDGISTYDLVIAPSNGTTIMNNVSDKNIISRLSGEPIFMGDKKYIGLKAWQTYSKQDLNSNPVVKEPEPIPVPPKEEPIPAPIPEPSVPSESHIIVGVNKIVELKDGDTYSGVVDIILTAKSKNPVTSMALYINGDLKIRSSGDVLRYTWDTRSLQKNRSYMIYVSATDSSNVLQKKNIKVYVK